MSSMSKLLSSPTKDGIIIIYGPYRKYLFRFYSICFSGAINSRRNSFFSLVADSSHRLKRTSATTEKSPISKPPGPPAKVCILNVFLISINHLGFCLNYHIHKWLLSCLHAFHFSFITDFRIFVFLGFHFLTNQSTNDYELKSY